MIPYNVVFDYIFKEILDAPTVSQAEQLYKRLQEKEDITFERFKLTLQKDLQWSEDAIGVLEKPEDKMTFQKFQQKFRSKQQSSLRYDFRYRTINDGFIAARLLAHVTCFEDFPICKHRCPLPWYDDELLSENSEVLVNKRSVQSYQSRVHSFNDNETNDTNSMKRMVNFDNFFEDFKKLISELTGSDREDFITRWG